MANLVFSKQLPCGLFEVYDDKPQENLSHCQQVHEAKVVHSSCAGIEVKADGVFNFAGDELTLAVITADCLPIAICGRKGNAMIHAGWRGLHSKILMTKEVMDLEPFYAFIGPHISQDNYEVSLDFQENFPHSEKSFSLRDEKLYFSLEKEAIAQLEQTYEAIKIESANICTYNDHNFHSYRREQASLRNWNLLRTI